MGLSRKIGQPLFLFDNAVLGKIGGYMLLCQSQIIANVVCYLNGLKSRYGMGIGSECKSATRGFSYSKYTHKLIFRKVKTALADRACVYLHINAKPCRS